MGLEFAHPEGAKFVMRRLYQRGVWAIFSTLDPRVLQYKPGLLLDQGTCERILTATEAAICEAREDALAEARPGEVTLSRPSETGAVPAFDLPRYPADPGARAVLAQRLAAWAADGEAPYPVASNAREA